MFSCLKILVIIDVLRKKGSTMEKLKNIRFNLRFFNGSDEPESVHSVKELEEKLRNNQIAFDDFMAYFFSGQLQRWLECHGEKDVALLEQLRAIDKKATNKEIVKALFAALGFCFDEQEIDRMIVSYDFPYRMKAEAVKNAKDAKQRFNALQDEIDAYESLCKQLIEKKNDPVFVRKRVKCIIEKYFPVLKLDGVRFFTKMKNPNNGCPAAILELLADPRGRSLFVIDSPPIDEIEESEIYANLQVSIINRHWLDFERQGRNFYVKIDNKPVEDARPIEIVPDYSDAVDDWRTLVPKGRRVMVLCNTGVLIRNGKGDEWYAGELNNRFLVLDGCSYRQEFKTTAYLAYMEL